MSNFTVPEDLTDLIDSIIAYKDKMKKQENYEDHMERLYIYDYIDDYYDKKESEEESYKIEIQI